jgi:hypothetical protein
VPVRGAHGWGAAFPGGHGIGAAFIGASWNVGIMGDKAQF